MAKDLTAIRIPGELVEILKAISAQPGGFYSERTTNWLIVQSVKEFIERHPQTNPSSLPGDQASK
jgi:hypothetical protein